MKTTSHLEAIANSTTDALVAIDQAGRVISWNNAAESLFGYSAEEQRLKRVFAIDIETCPDCSGKLRVIACIEEPWLIQRILAHVQRQDDPAGPSVRAPPGHCEDALGIS